jgi:hypothetical protein
VVDALVDTHGSLAAVAVRLGEERGHREDPESIERALRRLQARGQKDGGAWGQRVLAVFGLPGPLEARARWMGTYHSAFAQLPVAVAQDLLLPWDRPPVRESSARAWIRLAHAGLAMRVRDVDAGLAHLAHAGAAAPHAGPGAIVEHRLGVASIASRRDPKAVDALLAEAEDALAAVPAALADDIACWRARLVDQRGWTLNRRPRSLDDHARAEALYRALPDDGAPPFARCRRANGLAWSVFKQGRREEALALARYSAEIAGDHGSLRLRVMALSALAQFQEGTEEGLRARARANEVAARLEHADLAWRMRPRG